MNAHALLIVLFKHVFDKQNQTVQVMIDDDDDENEEFVCIVTQGDRDRLRMHLLEFRDVVLHSTSEQCEGTSPYVGYDIVCGLPSEMVESVVNHCEFIADSFDVEEKCLMWNWAGEIFRIIDNINSIVILLC